MQEPIGARIHELCDTTRPVAERRALLEEIVRTAAPALAAARQSSQLHADWPDRTAARTLGGDALFLLAVCLPEAAIATELENPASKDVESLGLAVRLASAAARYDACSAERFEPLLRTVLLDARPAFPWLEQDNASSKSFGAWAQEHHRIVMVQVAGNDPHKWQTLMATAVHNALQRGSEEPSLYNSFLDALQHGLSVEFLAGILTDTLADDTTLPTARISARKALDVLASLARHPDGTPPGMQAAMEQAFATADEHLARILRNNAAPETLRATIAENLHRWAPLTHQKLLGEGLLPRLPIPSRRQHKDWTPAGIETLARQIPCEEALALLNDLREDELDRIITVLRIAPSYTAWLPGALERFAPPFTALLSSRLTVPMKKEARTLGDMALEKFPELFPPIDSQTPEMQKLLVTGLRTAQAAGLEFDRIEDWLPNLLSSKALQQIRQP